MQWLSGGGAENKPDIEWYYVAPPADLHLHVLSLYCTVTFCFSTAASVELTISEQSDCASSLEFFCESLDWSFESFASLPHRFCLVESWPERTKLRKRANSLSFPPRPLLASCLSCNRPGNYYSFKIFLQFWLAKSTRIIHHKHLLMTKCGRILCLTRKWRQKCSLLQVNAPLTEKTWGRGWVVLVVKTKMADTSLVSRVRTTAGTRRNNS